MPTLPSDHPIWHNGRLASLRDVRMSPMDQGFTVGAGVFETMLGLNGEPLLWSRHYERLQNSAAPFGFSVPDGAELLEGCRAVLQATGIARARLRVTVSAGEGPPGSVLADGPPTVVIVAVPAPEFDQPARLVTVPWSRNSGAATTGLKTTSYAENVIALAEARRLGGDEALFLNTRGEVCEGTGSNVFFVADGQLRTPGVESGCLAGITREVVLEICDDLDIPVDPSPANLAVLNQAEEIFLTSSTRGIQAVGALDGRPLRHAPGPVTLNLQAVFSRFVENFGKMFENGLDSDADFMK